jgi:hypothetical protein
VARAVPTLPERTPLSAAAQHCTARAYTVST